MKAPLLADEAARLEALRRYEVLDTAAEQEFDDLTQMAAQICDVPISAITLVDQERQWFKSSVGLTMRETLRDVSFCTHAIAEPGLLLVPDAFADERFVENPFVTSEPHIRFYAGAPLVTPEGHAVGTLCVLDTVPRQLDQTQQEALRRLARQATTLLEARPDAAQRGQSRFARQQAEQRRLALAAEAARRGADSLKASEERYRRLFEASRNGILILDAASGRIEDVNPYLCELLGYAPHEFLGKPLWEIGAFRDIAASQEVFSALRKSEDIRLNDLTLRTKDGREAFVEFISNVYTAGDKKVMQCNIRDISERKQSAARVQEALRFVQSTLDALASHIAVLDETGEIIAVNKAWRQFSQAEGGDETACGVGANYIAVCESSSGVGAQEAQVLARGLREVIAGRREVFCLEYPCHSAREEHWFHACVTRFVGEGPVRVAVAHENITQRKQAQDLIRISEANLAKAQQIAHVGSWAWSLQSLEDFRGNPLSWSDEVFRIFGHQPGAIEVSYEAFINGVHPGDRDKVDAMLRLAFDTGENYNIEHRVVWPDGTERIVQERFDIVYDEHGRPLKMVGTVQDITEQKQAEAALRQSTEHLRALAASTSTIREEERTQISREVHDVLGQALTSLKMDVAWLEEMLATGKPDPEGSMLRKTRSMLPFIDTTIQSVQRIASQLRPALLDDFGLEAAIEWQVQEWKERTGIQCDYVSSLGEIALRPEQATTVFRILQEALTNIVRHAAASRVSVLLEENAGLLVLEVQDNGRGIKERRVSVARAKSLGVLGMQERARLVGGEVVINSGEGKGTTVTVRIPLSPEQVAQGLRPEETEREEQP